MSHEESVRLGQVVHLVEQAVHLEPTIKGESKDLVSAAERVLFALRVALEDAGAENPVAVMAAAVGRYEGFRTVQSPAKPTQNPADSTRKARRA